MTRPNPLRIGELTVDMEVAVYIPGLERPLYGLVKAWDAKTKRVSIEVSRKHRVARIEVDLAQIVPW